MARIALIAALAENRVIGREGNLPWRIPADLKFFKATTSGKAVVMGRKTFASIGRPLPNRLNIVVTRDDGFRPDGVSVAGSIAAALALAASSAGEDEVMVIGGAEIYAAALPLARRLYLTEVHAAFDGDACFPALEPRQWAERSRERRHQEQPMPLDFSFVVLERVA